VQSTVTDKRETSSGERGLVTMRVEAFVVDADADRLDEEEDEDELLVCEFERTVLSLKEENAN
jgi:acyl dehydratase